MAAKVFVDTNILLRAILAQMPQHLSANEMLKRVIRDGGELWLSGQVIREFIVQATHPRTLNTPLTTLQAVQHVNALQGLFRVADETASVRAELLTLIQAHPTQGKQVHDANIVATMLAYQIPTLLTLNLVDFQRFSGLISLQTL